MHGAIQSVWPGWEHGCKNEMKKCDGHHAALATLDAAVGTKL